MTSWESADSPLVPLVLAAGVARRSGKRDWPSRSACETTSWVSALCRCRTAFAPKKVPGVWDWCSSSGVKSEATGAVVSLSKGMFARRSGFGREVVMTRQRREGGRQYSKTLSISKAVVPVLQPTRLPGTDATLPSVRASSEVPPPLT